MTTETVRDDRAGKGRPVMVLIVGATPRKRSMVCVTPGSIGNSTGCDMKTILLLDVASTGTAPTEFNQGMTTN